MEFLKIIVWVKLLYKGSLKVESQVQQMWLSSQKGEIESNFLTTLTDKPKFNYLVQTILNQIVIQFELSKRCI